MKMNMRPAQWGVPRQLLRGPQLSEVSSANPVWLPDVWSPGHYGADSSTACIERLAACLQLRFASLGAELTVNGQVELDLPAVAQANPSARRGDQKEPEPRNADHGRSRHGRANAYPVHRGNGARWMLPCPFRGTGAPVYVTARGSDAVLASDTKDLVDRPESTLTGAVRWVKPRWAWHSSHDRTMIVATRIAPQLPVRGQPCPGQRSGAPATRSAIAADPAHCV